MLIPAKIAYYRDVSKFLIIHTPVFKLSNNWSVMIDETNSITDEKHLAIISRHISHNVPVTRYLGIINLDELNAEAITSNLKNFILAKGLNVKNLLHFGSDGAVTLTGTKT